MIVHRFKVSKAVAHSEAQRAKRVVFARELPQAKRATFQSITTWRESAASAAIEAVDADGLDVDIVVNQVERKAGLIYIQDTTLIVSGALESVAESAAIDASRALRREITFNPFANRAVKFAEQNAARMVTSINETTREGLKTLIAEAKKINLHPRDPKLQTMIRESVGLTPGHSRAVTNYYLQMADAGVDAAKMERNVRVYADRLHKLRSDTIARSELLTATEAGISEGWMSAVDEGIVEQQRLSQRWMTAQDERVSVWVCRPMHGQVRAMGQMFMTGDGRMIEAPPAHVLCRCDREITVADRAVESFTPKRPRDAVRGKVTPSRRLKPRY